MRITLIPLLGPLHLRCPRYNAVSVRDAVAASAPEALAVAALSDLETPGWQETPEIALPLAVIPWARQRSLPVYPVLEPSPDPAAAGDFQRYLRQYPERARDLLKDVDASLRPVDALLEQPLTLPCIEEELLPALRTHQELCEQHFSDGPGTDWLRARSETMAERILNLPHTCLTILAGVEQLPFLVDTLQGRAEVMFPPEPAPSEKAQERSLLDVAFRGETYSENLLTQLRGLESAEARYHEANLLFAGGRLGEALEVLQSTSQGDFSQPYFLPGYLLARLGQLRDLADERSRALRAYRGVLALDWAPREAVEAAQAGLREPFALPEQTPVK